MICVLIFVIVGHVKEFSSSLKVQMNPMAVYIYPIPEPWLAILIVHKVQIGIQFKQLTKQKKQPVFFFSLKLLQISNQK